MDIKGFLNERKVPFEVIRHPWAAGASRVAHAAHVPGAQFAKSVFLRVNHGYRDVIALVPSHLQVDPAKASVILGGAEIKFGNEADLVVRCPDCERGVLPPFGSQYGMRVIADAALAQGDDIVFEGNTHDEAIRMKWDDFCRLENPLVGHLGIAAQLATR